LGFHDGHELIRHPVIEGEGHHNCIHIQPPV